MAIGGHLLIGERHAFGESVNAKTGEREHGKCLAGNGMNMHMAVLDAAAEEFEHHLQQETTKDPKPDGRTFISIQLGKHVQEHDPEQEGTAEGKQQPHPVHSRTKPANDHARYHGQQEERKRDRDRHAPGFFIHSTKRVERNGSNGVGSGPSVRSSIEKPASAAIRSSSSGIKTCTFSMKSCT